ncbi:MAG: hypothetical protein VB855_03795 [Pirellulaceae bacterium]
MRCATLLCFLLLFSATLAIPSRDAPGVDVADLKDQLKNGLRVRRPGDLAFIDAVVEQVEQGRLPLSLVKSTFQWARTKMTRYPFPYFAKALRIRAGKLGIKL